MKKYVICFLLVLSLVLPSCQNLHLNEENSLVSGIASDTIPEESTSLQSVDTNEESISTDSKIYSFDSYDDLLASFSISGMDDNTVQAEKAMYGEIYQAFVDEMSGDGTNIIVPYFNGSPMSLRNKEGLSNITLMTREFVALPWIWYYGIYNGGNIVIKVTYPPIDVPQGYSASQVLNAINPNAVNIHNYQNFSNYEDVYSLDVSLNDTELNALVYEYKNSTKKTVSIYHDGFFICIDAESEMFDDVFWCSLSFE